MEIRDEDIRRKLVEVREGRSGPWNGRRIKKEMRE